MKSNSVSSFKGWHQVAATMLLQAVATGSVFISFSVLAKAYGEEFHPDRSVLMMALTAVIIANGVLGPILGRALEKFSIKRLMIFGVAMLGAGFLLVSQAQAMLHVIIIYLLFMSFATTLGGPIAGAALLSRWFTKRRGLAMSLSAAGAAVGGLLAPPILQWLIEDMGWRQALGLYGVIVMFITVPIIALFIIDRPELVGQSPDGEPSVQKASAQHLPTLGWSYYVKDRNFWFLSLTLGILFASSMGVASNLIQSVAEKGISATQGAYLLSVYSTLNFVGKMLSGALADKFSPRQIFSVIIIVFTCAVIGLGHASQYVYLIVACLFFGLSQGAIVPLWSVLIARLYGPERVGSSMGMMSTVITPFNFMAPPLFGLSYDVTGSYYAAYLACIALLVVAYVLQNFIDDLRSVS